MPKFNLPQRRSRRERERARQRRGERREAARKRAASVVRGLLVAAALLLSFLPVPFVASPIAYVPFLTVVLLLAFDRAYLAALKRSLAFNEDVMGRSCRRGERVELAVVFENSSFLAYPRIEVMFYISDLFGGYAKELSVSTALTPHEKRDFKFDARFAHLGTYTAGVDSVRIWDLLGLWSATIENTRRNEVRVLPRLFDFGRVELSNVSLEESQKVFRPIVADDIDYAGVRDYRAGDPLKSVHWKLSSRNPDEMMYTRLFEVLGNPGVETIVDPFAPDYDSEDLMHVFDGLVEGALSVDEYSRANGMETRLAFLDANHEPASAQVTSGSGPEELVGRMCAVSRASSEHDEREPSNLLRREGSLNHGMGNVVYCTSRVEGDVLAALVDMKMRGRNPLLVLVVPRSVEGKERERFLAPLRQLDAAQVGYYILESTEQATEVVGR